MADDKDDDEATDEATPTPANGQWQFEVLGDTFTADDFTIGEMVALERLGGRPWSGPAAPVLSGTDWFAHAVVWLSRRMKEEKAVRIVSRIAAEDALKGIKFVPADMPDEWGDDGLPKAADDQMTSGSSGQPDSSTGPPTSPDASPSEISVS